MLSRVSDTDIMAAIGAQVATIRASIDAANTAWAAIKVTVDAAKTAGLGMDDAAVGALQTAINAANGLGTTASTGAIATKPLAMVVAE